jgi:hypothetical protein
MMWDS